MTRHCERSIFRFLCRASDHRWLSPCGAFMSGRRAQRFVVCVVYFGMILQSALLCNPGCFVQFIPKKHIKPNPTIAVQIYICGMRHGSKLCAICSNRPCASAFELRRPEHERILVRLLRGELPCNLGRFVRALPIRYLYVHA